MNIVLIGMPGAGKSTVGVVLAKKLGLSFLDSDLVIQEKEGKLLHELIEEHGVEGFWQIENDVNASLNPVNAVIATGGSVIYGREAMHHLQTIGKVVYLKLPYNEVAERLGDLNARGVTLREGQSLSDLYEERIPMYEQYAHITVECSGHTLREVVECVVNALDK
jgi:shikimate kinase